MSDHPIGKFLDKIDTEKVLTGFEIIDLFHQFHSLIKEDFIEDSRDQFSFVMSSLTFEQSLKLLLLSTKIEKFTKNLVRGLGLSIIVKAKTGDSEALNWLEEGRFNNENWITSICRNCLEISRDFQ